MKNSILVFAERSLVRRSIEVTVLERGPDGTESIAKPLEMEALDLERLTTKPPTMSLDGTAAQQLMDELWRCGTRPTEGAGSAGSLAATERHLKDMQSITFGLLRKDGSLPGGETS